MNYKIIGPVLLLLLLSNCTLMAQFNSIRINGNDYFINGVNIPWNTFGWDFGVHERWGRGYDADWFESTFAELESSGVNCARIWIHCDGRANPNFDASGKVIGLDAGMLDEVEDMVVRANNHNLMLIITLWSYDMLEDHRSIGGRHAGLHRELITDPEKTQSYLDHALIPLVQRLRTHCNILAWEIINEPEWAMEVSHGGTTSQTVSVEEMQYFVGQCISAIRNHSDQYITLGTAVPISNGGGQYTNYWHETAFQQFDFNCAEVHLDFYSIHYYDWMGEDYSPFEKEANYWELGKPILIAETASNNLTSTTLIDPQRQIELSFEQDYAGILFWSYNANDSFSDWENCKNALNAFRDFNADIVDYSAGQCEETDNAPPALMCKLYPNPAQDQLYLALHFDEAFRFTLALQIFNAQGALLSSIQTADLQAPLDIRHLPPAMYQLHIRVLDEQEQLVQQRIQKFLVLK
ncbi:MAG: T9SS type A sorting domain-containing protein [Bacteroidota bacterium]